MPEEIQLIITVFVFFILTGLFGGIGIWSIFHQKKKRAIWSFSIGLIMIIIYLVVMFSFGII
ncbi:hypothetical protein [Halalkalibacter alkalisediminis]|uniref:Uncharacterized protein n=1 Tax=Halalkalibacter alkalisediminis TaxID=935616 RepID=A0ABV6NGS1_9BACI|nr:hypothetical protein [Halalkalibacter alkalisediminis]